MAPISLWAWEMLVGRIPVAVFGDRYEVPGTTQLFGTEALGHPALHLCDVATLRSRDEDALDAPGSESLGHFRTSRRVQRRSCHTERLSPLVHGDYRQGALALPPAKQSAESSARRGALQTVGFDFSADRVGCGTIGIGAALPRRGTPLRISVGLGVGGLTGSGSRQLALRARVCIVLRVRVRSVTGGRSMATTEDLAQICSGSTLRWRGRSQRPCFGCPETWDWTAIRG